MGTQLTTPETRQLREHEQVMAECIDSVFKFAEHARAIREDRLYRAEYKTFEDYCRKRWDLSYRYVNKQIEAAEAAEDVSEVVTEMGTRVPKTVSIGSQLAQINSIPERADVWKKAVETAPKSKVTGEPNVTAAHVAKTRKAMFPPEESNGELQPDPVESIRALIKKVDDVRKAIDDIQPVHKTESLLWLTALDKLDEGRKALFKLTQ